MSIPLQEHASTHNANLSQTQSLAVESEKPVAEVKSKRGCSGIAIVLIFLVLSILFFCGLSFFTMIALLGDSEGSDTVVSRGGGDRIALIHVDGVITQSAESGFLSTTFPTTSSVIISELDQAMLDSTVKAVVLNIESPGGEVVASDLIFQKVMQVRQSKPVVAYSGSISTSGGYMVASAANRFIVHPSDMTGSIGVILQISSVEGLYEKLGIEVATFTSGDMKDTSSLFEEDSSEKAERIFQEMIDESYELFLSRIVEGRGMNRARLTQLADGRIYTGRQAVENGLADDLGFLSDAVASAEELADVSGTTIIEYNRTPSFFSLILGKSSSVESLLFPTKGIPPFGVYYMPEHIQ